VVAYDYFSRCYIKAITTKKKQKWKSTNDPIENKLDMKIKNFQVIAIYKIEKASKLGIQRFSTLPKIKFWKSHSLNTQPNSNSS